MTPQEQYISLITNDVAKVLNKEVRIKFVTDKRWQGRCLIKDGEHIIEYNSTKINQYPNIALWNLAVHEACHLKHMNHSKRFKSLCKKFGMIEYYWLCGCPSKSDRPAYMKDL